MEYYEKELHYYFIPYHRKYCDAKHNGKVGCHFLFSFLFWVSCRGTVAHICNAQIKISVHIY